MLPNSPQLGHLSERQLSDERALCFIRHNSQAIRLAAGARQPGKQLVSSHTAAEGDAQLLLCRCPHCRSQVRATAEVCRELPPLPLRLLRLLLLCLLRLLLRVGGRRRTLPLLCLLLLLLCLLLRLLRLLRLLPCWSC